MVERTPFLDVFTQVLLFLGLLVALAPFAIVAIAATHDLRTVNQVPMPLVPGHDFMNNVAEAWAAGRSRPQDRQQHRLRGRRGGRQGRHRRAVGLLAGLLPLSRPRAHLLADLHHADAAARGPHRADLRGRRQRAQPLSDAPRPHRHLLADRADDRLPDRAAMGAAQHLYRPDPAA